MEAIAAEYGKILVDACGLKGVPAYSALDHFEPVGELDADTCFVNYEDPECVSFLEQGALINFPRPASAAPRTDWTQDVRWTMCRAYDLRRFHASARFDWGEFFEDAIFWAAIEEYGPLFMDAVLLFDLHNRPIAVRVADYNFDLRVLQSLPIDAPQHRLDLAAAYCSDILDGIDGSLPTLRETDVDLTSHAHCFQGGLGEAFLGAVGSARGVEIELNNWLDARQRYDSAARRCLRLDATGIDMQRLTSNFNDAMDRDGETLTELSMMSTAAFTAIGTMTGAGIGDPTAPAQTILHTRMASRQRAYEAKMAMVQQDRTMYDCFSEARSIWSVIDNHISVIQRAIAEADGHIVRYEGFKSVVDNAVLDGRGSLVREAGREVPPIAFHYWLDERVDRFHKDFEWARSLTYLAMQAVEFEYQQSMALRDDILEATHPDQLLDVVRAMEQTQISRTINGRRPEDAKLVRSLAQDILGFTATVPSAPGERAWTAAERFQNRIWSAEYAVYDDDGAYLGQGIPFTLAPEGELDYTCAERVWSVTATLQGDALSEVEPSVPLMIMKRNHFGSQWCSGKGDGSPLQTAAVRPVSQLFHPEDRGGDESAINDFVTAHIWPWLNVPRSELYREAYAEGASTELAGRGLYGEYVLLFPAHGLLSDGFPLQRIEDVLLRFDYLAVDNLQARPGALAADSASQ